MTTQHFHAQIAGGKPSLGHFVMEFMSPGIGTIAARAGADWVLFDLEHSGYGLDSARAALTVSRSLDIASFVRVPGAQPHLVSTALDAGAEGIMVPYVNSVEQAALIGSWLRYPPLGVRGSAFGMPTEMYSATDPGGKQAQANESVVFLPQIETPEAVAAADAIAALDAVTAPFVGPLDLSTNLGAPGDFTSVEFTDAMRTVASAAQNHGKAAGVFAPNAAFTEMALELGFTVLALGADVSVYQNALAGLLDAARAAAGSD